MTIDIDAIRQREQAATPGPWKAVDFNHDTAPRTAYGVWGESDDDLCIFEDVDTLLADAEFIAHARQDIPALLAEVAKLSARNKVWEDHLRQAQAKLADLADKLHKANAANASLTKAGTAWANEVAAKDKVVEAAKEWRAQFAKPAASKAPRMRALIEAVDALPKKAEVTPADRAQGPRPGQFCAKHFSWLCQAGQGRCQAEKAEVA